MSDVFVGAITVGAMLGLFEWALNVATATLRIGEEVSDT